MTRAAIVVAGALALLAVTPGSVQACSCAPTRSACQALWNAGAVFAGEVIDITNLDPKKKPPAPDTRRVRIKVLETFAGAQSDEVEVFTAPDGAMCGYPFTRGDRYLVFAYEYADGSLGVSICSPTRHMTRFNGDLSYLRSLKAAKAPLGRLRGRVTYVVGSPAGSGAGRPRPFDGARIAASADGRTIDVVTDREGRFEILAPPGRYKVDVRVPDGFYVQPHTPNVWILDPESCGEMPVRVQPDGHVSGRVVTADGVPLAHVAVTLGQPKYVARLASSYGWSARTDALGRFRVDKLPPGRYVLGLLIPQFPSPPDSGIPVLRSPAEPGAAPREIDVTVGGRVDVGDFVIRDNPNLVTISGMVVDLANRPLRDIKVELRSAASRLMGIGPAVTTGDDGRFAFAAVPGMTYGLAAQSYPWGLWGARSERVDIVAAADSPPVTITLPVPKQRRP